MERLAHGAEHLAQAGGLGGRDAQCPDHLLFVQAEQLAAGGGGSHHAGGAGDVPAGVVVVRVYRVADPALDLDAQHERVHEVFAADRTVLGEGQDCRAHRAGRMDHRLQVGVVEVEHVRADAVEQRGMQDVEPLAAAEHRGLGCACHRRERGQRDVHALMVRAADCTAEPVDEGARRMVAGGGRDRFETRLDDVAGEDSGDFFHVRLLACECRAARIVARAAGTKKPRFYRTAASGYCLLAIRRFPAFSSGYRTATTTACLRQRRWPPSRPGRSARPCCRPGPW